MLFDLLAAEVPAWPISSAADHYRSLFRFLGQQLGKRVTVERTGGSIVMVDAESTAPDACAPGTEAFALADSRLKETAAT
jgi:hypothetical protein